MTAGINGVTGIEGNTSNVDTISTSTQTTKPVLFEEISTDEDTIKQQEAKKAQEEEKLNQIKEQMSELKAKIGEKQEEIEKKQEEITQLVEKATSKRKKLKDEQKQATQDATAEVLEMYQEGKITRNQFAQTLKAKISTNLSTSSTSREIENILDSLDTVADEVDILMDEVDSLANQKETFQSSYINAKSSVLMCEKIIANSTNSDNSSSNSEKYTSEQTSYVADLAVDFGATSNKNQTGVLAQNYENIFANMQDKNFSYNNAMNALFGTNGLFSSSGVSYNSKEGNYSVSEDLQKSNPNLADNLKAQIYSAWGQSPKGSAVTTSADKLDSEQTAVSEAEEMVSNESIENLGLALSKVENARNTAQEARSAYETDLDEIEADNNAQVAAMGQTAQEYSAAGPWEKAKETITTLAQTDGTTLDDEAWKELEGIYSSNLELDSNGIYSQYQLKHSEEKMTSEIQEGDDVSDNTNFITDCYENAKRNGVDDISRAEIEKYLEKHSTEVDVDKIVSDIKKEREMRETAENRSNNSIAQ